MTFHCSPGFVYLIAYEGIGGETSEKAEEVTLSGKRIKQEWSAKIC
ncbi:hypothetical protein [Runella sp.]|jgi:hypothetical protein|nr:hypothetical protein [Runella sp.]